MIYLAALYLIIINIVTCVIYVREADTPSRRKPVFLLMLLPVIGGAPGACIANYCCDVEYRSPRSSIGIFLCIVPSFCFVLYYILSTSFLGVPNIFILAASVIIATSGGIGVAICVLNVLAFIFVILRKFSYYLLPNGNFLIPDLILLPILLLGGATGGAIAKLVFNFKEDWGCNSTMDVEDFCYNNGMFVISVIHIILYVVLFI